MRLMARFEDRKNDSRLESIENAPKSGKPKFMTKLHQKSKKLLKEMLGIQYVI